MSRPEPLYGGGDVVRNTHNQNGGPWSGDLTIIDTVHYINGVWVYLVSNDGTKEGRKAQFIETVLMPAFMYDAAKEPVR